MTSFFVVVVFYIALIKGKTTWIPVNDIIHTPFIT